MANYVDSTVFINGSKRAIVDFLNKGLKNNKQKIKVKSQNNAPSLPTSVKICKVSEKELMRSISLIHFFSLIIVHIKKKTIAKGNKDDETLAIVYIVPTSTNSTSCSYLLFLAAPKSPYEKTSTTPEAK